jgi:hypothetical protein
MRRRAGGRRCGARGRGSQPHPREAPAKPSAGTKTGRLQWLDAADAKGGGSRPDEGTQGVPRPSGSTAPGTEKPRWSAAGRASSSPRTPAPPGVDCYGRLAALHPLARRERGQERPGNKPGGTTACPGPQRIRATALGCLTTETDVTRGNAGGRINLSR